MNRVRALLLVRLVLALWAGLMRANEAVWVWFTGADLELQGVSGTPLLRERRDRRKLAFRALIALGVLWLLLWLVICKKFGLSPAAGFWTALAVTVGPSTLWLVWAGWDSNIANDLPAKPTGKVPDKDTVRQAVATAVKGMRADQWQNIRVMAPGLTKTGEWWDIVLAMPNGIDWQAVRKVTPGIGVDLGIDDERIIVSKGSNSTTRVSGTSRPMWNKERVTPLAGTDRTNVFAPAPLATDGRGKELATLVLFTGIVIGAIPRQGKTQAGRLVALYWALDPVTDIALFDFKGQGDWAMFRKIATKCVEGRSKKHVEALRDYLRWLANVEITRRTDVMNSLAAQGSGVDSQLTEKLARSQRHNLRPLLVPIDEAQYAISDRDYGRDITRLLEDIVRIGPSVGVVIMLMTQKPDAGSVPTSVRDVMGTRVALKCRSIDASMAILGGEAQKAGWDASKISDVKGVGIYLGADDESTVSGFHTVRFDRADSDLAWKICERAERLRGAAGTLPEGHDVEPPAVLREMHRVLSDPKQNGKMRSAEMAAHLHTLGMLDGETEQQRWNEVAEMVAPWGAEPHRDRGNPEQPNARTWFLDGPAGVDAAIRSRPTVGAVPGAVSGAVPRNRRAVPDPPRTTQRTPLGTAPGTVLDAEGQHG